MRRLRRLVPVALQPSGMDCGPAALAGVLRGHGLPVDYEALRAQCQTGRTGTTVDALEDAARAHGVDARQVLLPPGELARPSPAMLPALAIVRTPGDQPHVVAIWRRYGNLLQIMDPAAGRRWRTSRALGRELWLHEQVIDDETWRAALAQDGTVSALEDRSAAPARTGPAADGVRVRGAVAVVVPGPARSGPPPRRPRGGAAARQARDLVGLLPVCVASVAVLAGVAAALHEPGPLTLALAATGAAAWSLTELVTDLARRRAARRRVLSLMRGLTPPQGPRRTAWLATRPPSDVAGRLATAHVTAARRLARDGPLRAGLEAALVLLLLGVLQPGMAIMAGVVTAAVAAAALALGLVLREPHLRAAGHGAAAERLAFDLTCGATTAAVHGGLSACRVEHDRRLDRWAAHAGRCARLDVLVGTAEVGVALATAVWAFGVVGVSGRPLLVAAALTAWSVAAPRLGIALLQELREGPDRRSRDAQLSDLVDGLQASPAPAPAAVVPGSPGPPAGAAPARPVAPPAVRSPLRVVLPYLAATAVRCASVAALWLLSLAALTGAGPVPAWPVIMALAVLAVALAGATGLERRQAALLAVRYERQLRARAFGVGLRGRARPPGLLRAATGLGVGDAAPAPGTIAALGAAAGDALLAVALVVAATGGPALWGLALLAGWTAVIGALARRLRHRHRATIGARTRWVHWAITRLYPQARPPGPNPVGEQAAALAGADRSAALLTAVPGAFLATCLAGLLVATRTGGLSPQAVPAALVAAFFATTALGRLAGAAAALGQAFAARDVVLAGHDDAAEAWAPRAAPADGNDEQHVFLHTLAFNLLLGRRWPPAAGDLEAAQAACVRAGLGELVARLPAGLQQLIGETAHALTGPERVALGVARAELATADRERDHARPAVPARAR